MFIEWAEKNQPKPHTHTCVPTARDRTSGLFDLRAGAKTGIMIIPKHLAISLFYKHYKYAVNASTLSITTFAKSIRCMCYKAVAVVTPSYYCIILLTRETLFSFYLLCFALVPGKSVLYKVRETRELKTTTSRVQIQGLFCFFLGEKKPKSDAMISGAETLGTRQQEWTHPLD